MSRAATRTVPPSAPASAASAASPLADCPVGVVPILWNNTDLLDLAPEVPAEVVLDEIARLGFDGCQTGRGFPTGDALRAALEARGLRLAEHYVALPATPSGPAPEAAEVARAGLGALIAASGEVLVVALHASPERDPWSGRVAEGAPRWPEAAFGEFAALLAALAVDAERHGIRVGFHPHTATWIEAPDEVEALAQAIESTGAGICLDVGHYLVGGGDPVEALRRYAGRVVHLHVKDVDPAVSADLRSGRYAGFAAAVRARIFTELGSGVLDVDGLLAELARQDYRGWLMLEQDSSWLRPAEAAAIARSVYGFALRRLMEGA